MHRPNKIISGGQTGADLGALVGARRVGITTGGCAPRGYKTEKGCQEQALRGFGLVAHPSEKYELRTKENIKNSDATLIISTLQDSVGTQLTIQLCEQTSKPYLLINPDTKETVSQILDFIEHETPLVLNVAGNRETRSPGIASKTAKIIQQVFGI